MAGVRTQAIKALKVVHLDRPIRKLGRQPSPFATFFTEDASSINRARMAHLGSLGLDLDEKSVLEVGSGIGLLTGWFEDRGCTVVSSDAREDNVAENLRSHPWRSVSLSDLDEEVQLADGGHFDVAFCYGTLYHLKRPRHALEILAAAAPLLLLETCVSTEERSAENLVSEDRSCFSQAQSGIGCRPSRSWVMHQLEDLWGHAYVTVTQPDHPDFPLEWTGRPPSDERLTRSVFVASKLSLHENPMLSSTLPARQQRQGA